MHTSEIRRFFKGAALVATIAIAGVATPSVASAQGNAGGADAGRTVSSSYGDDNDGGSKSGWFGLLGLAGLLGMRRRDNGMDVNRRPDATRR